MDNPSAMVPMMRERREQYERSSFNELLREARIIFLGGGIDDEVANNVVMALLYFEREDPDKDIHVYINSPGGHIHAGLAIYDTIQLIHAPVSTYAVGLAASMGTILLTAGTKGKRYALPNATIHLHQPLGGFQGQAADIEIEAREILRMRDLLNGILKRHTKMSDDDIIKYTDRNYYMTPERAKELGVIDDILVASPKGEEKK